MTNTRFKSKIDWWVYALIFGWIGVNLWSIIDLTARGGVGAIILVAMFTPFTVFVFVPLLIRTYYEFGENELVIKCGLGKGTKIAYGSIISAERTRNPISSPALSMDRVEVKYKYTSGNFTDSIIISPANREGFFRELESKNCNIATCCERKPLSRGYKILFNVIWGFMGFVLIGIVVMTISGVSDPTVIVHNDRVEIRGMYGVTVGADEIISVSLIENSLSDYNNENSMGLRRTNGYGDGISQSLKGYFSTNDRGAVILFAQVNTAPTIHIERRAMDIFISFRNSEKTEQIYRDLVNLVDN